MKQDKTETGGLGSVVCDWLKMTVGGNIVSSMLFGTIVIAIVFLIMRLTIGSAGDMIMTPYCVMWPFACLYGYVMMRSGRLSHTWIMLAEGERTGSFFQTDESCRITQTVLSVGGNTVVLDGAYLTDGHRHQYIRVLRNGYGRHRIEPISEETT